MSNWINVLDQAPEVGQQVAFTAYVEGCYSDIEIGKWTGGKTMGDAIVMDYGEADDWYPCTHWLALPELPIIEEK